MAKRKIGALITIERTTGLEEYVETGIALDADITGRTIDQYFYSQHTFARRSSHYTRRQNCGFECVSAPFRKLVDS